MDSASMTDATTTSNDINAAVHTAREELAGVVRALTQVLKAVALEEQEAKLPEKAQNGGDAEAARLEREAKAKRRSLAPVLARFDKLRIAVDTAVRLREERIQDANKEEHCVTEEERQALQDRKAALVADVRAKNIRVKVLIDHLRELHRDIVVLLGNYYKPAPAQGRKV